MIHESRRIYGKVKNVSIDCLRQAFDQLPYVEIALLFGSRAALDLSKVNSQSDYDFAVLMDKSHPCDWGHLALIRTDLGGILDLSDEDFDVVDMEVATPELIESIAAQYQIIKGDYHAVRGLFSKYRKDG